MTYIITRERQTLRCGADTGTLAGGEKKPHISGGGGLLVVDLAGTRLVATVPSRNIFCYPDFRQERALLKARRCVGSGIGIPEDDTVRAPYR